MRPALETRNLTIGYRRRGEADVCLAKALNLRLQGRALVGLLGPNGVGKSTLLRTFAGLQKPLGGQVLLADEDVTAIAPRDLARKLSMVLTAAPPPALMNGYAIVALGRQPHTDWLGRLTDKDRHMIAIALRAVDGADLAEQRLAELSDGQRQKLMIARALAQQSEFMLLDEPTAYLDLPRKIETMALLKRLTRSEARAILVATHDIDLAMRYCDSLWLMSKDGIICGAPEDLALDGSLGGAFRADGIRFDQSRGRFYRERPGGQAVMVVGEDEHAAWLRRAVTRAGYSVSSGSSRAIVSRSRNGSGPRWKLRIDERVGYHGTIEAVLRALECNLT